MEPTDFSVYTLPSHKGTVRLACTLAIAAQALRDKYAAMREAPDNADCWAMLSLMYTIEFVDGFNTGPNPLDRALAAAQRAVNLGPALALGHYALAFVYFSRKEMVPFRAEAEKTLAPNPMDGSVMGILGVLIDHAGEFERGCQMVEAAMQLNPNYPGLFRFPLFATAYRQRKYAEALELAVRINMPNFFHAHAARAAALGQLGQREAAEKELREVLALRPDFATAARREYAKWYDSDLVEHLIDGLRKAGLEIRNEPEKVVAGKAPLPARLAPTRDFGSRCCHSNPRARTPNSRPSPKDSRKKSSPDSRASPTSA